MLLLLSKLLVLDFRVRVKLRKVAKERTGGKVVIQGNWIIPHSMSSSAFFPCFSEINQFICQCAVVSHDLVLVLLSS